MRIGQNGSCWEIFLDYQFKVNGEKWIFSQIGETQTNFHLPKIVVNLQLCFILFPQFVPNFPLWRKMSFIKVLALVQFVPHRLNTISFMLAPNVTDHESRRSQTPRNNSNSFFTPNYFVMIHSAQFIFRFYLLAIRSSRFIPLTPYFHFTTF